MERIDLDDLRVAKLKYDLAREAFFAMSPWDVERDEAERLHKEFAETLHAYKQELMKHSLPSPI